MKRIEREDLNEYQEMLSCPSRGSRSVLRMRSERGRFSRRRGRRAAVNGCHRRRLKRVAW